MRSAWTVIPSTTPGRQVLHVVERDRRVGQDHPLGAGVRDVALVPEGDVLQADLRVAAQDARQAGDPLGQDRVALVGHRRGALLARAERLLDLAHLGPLQVADLGREALQARRRRSRSASQHRVAVARDDLGRDVLARAGRAPPSPAPRPTAGPRRRCRPRPRACRRRAARRRSASRCRLRSRLEREAGQPQPEGGRLGVDAVGAADAERLGVLARPRDQRVAVGRARPRRGSRRPRAAAAPARCRARPRR